MKRILTAVFICLLLSMVFAAPLMADEKEGTTIQDGIILYSAGHYLEGEPLQVGFDIFGYNYQALMFKGSYANAYLGKDGLPPYEGDTAAYLAENPSAATKWYWPYRDDQLLMIWNDAWLSNMDRDGDGSLDRHYGYASYIGSGAWLTNHQWGTYEADGKTCNWDYFCKIVAAPADAVKDGAVWYAADGTEIGPVIWGEFAIILEVYNDTGTGDHGVLYNSPAPTGFGYYFP